ncbi:Shikimate dehydrogenase (NADP(+)) [Cellulomonas sp. T2.31MG-18]
MLLVGRDTAGSGVHTAFPVWARALGLGNVVLRDVDVHADAARQVWRDLVGAMRNNPRVRGAVVTDDKLRLYRACADLVDVQEPTVGLMAEINSLRLDDGRVWAFARDALALHTVLGHAPLPAAPPAVVCLGAGGAATALLLATALDVPATTAATTQEPVAAPAIPALTFVDRDPDALDALRRVLDRLPVDAAAVRMLTAPTPQACAEVVAAAPAGALVVNATGLGKVGPGSPLPDGAAFPADAVAWDFNDRGPLTFLAQARAAGVAAVDGRDYFLAGWACALGAVFDLDPARALTAIRGTEPAAA